MRRDADNVLRFASSAPLWWTWVVPGTLIAFAAMVGAEPALAFGLGLVAGLSLFASI
jgi:hypothetical protein